MNTANAPNCPVNSDVDAKIVSTMSDYPGMKKIIAEYVQGLADDVRKMRELLSRGDMPALRRVVHQLRGTGGGYGFDLLSELATTAEDAISAAEPTASIASKIDSLIDAIHRIEGFDESAVIQQGKGGTL